MKDLMIVDFNSDAQSFSRILLTSVDVVKNGGMILQLSMLIIFYGA